MKFGSAKNSPKAGQKRFVRKFAVFPVKITRKDMYVWFEHYWQEQTYSQWYNEWFKLVNLTEEEYDKEVT